MTTALSTEQRSLDLAAQPAVNANWSGMDLDTASLSQATDEYKLRAAFEFFNAHSQQLTEAYKSLEQQVTLLTEELTRVEAQHKLEVEDKERVTGRLEDLLSLLPVGVVVLDVRGRVQDCNPAALDLLGEPLLGELWLDIIHRCFAPRLDDGHEVSLKDGRRVSISTRSLEVEPGQLIVLTDQTETRAMQEHLSRHKRLSALGKMVASLAHQIRTPLSAAMLYGEHLANTELQPQQQQRFAGKLMSRLNHLEHQVRDMLVFARGKLPLVDIVTSRQLAENLEKAIEAPIAASESGCSLENRAPDALLQCNQEALIGAICNLVNNAIQAVGKGAQIDIQFQQTESSQLNIRVRDHGPGLDQSIRENLLEPFVTTKAQGTGLGLAVVQAVIRAHHGEFRIESEVGQGVEANLLLPLKNADEINEQMNKQQEELA